MLDYDTVADNIEVSSMHTLQVPAEVVTDRRILMAWLGILASPWRARRRRTDVSRWPSAEDWVKGAKKEIRVAEARDGNSAQRIDHWHVIITGVLGAPGRRVVRRRQRPKRARPVLEVENSDRQQVGCRLLAEAAARAAAHRAAAHRAAAWGLRGGAHENVAQPRPTVCLREGGCSEHSGGGGRVGINVLGVSWAQAIPSSRSSAIATDKAEGISSPRCARGGDSLEATPCADRRRSTVAAWQARLASRPGKMAALADRLETQSGASAEGDYGPKW